MRSLLTAVRFEPRRSYDGSQLHPHFLRQAFGLCGDAAVAFRGSCRVEGNQLVDLEDRLVGDFIAARDMVHVIVERFDSDLPRMVLVQRLLSSLCADLLRSRIADHSRFSVCRKGDDVFVGEGKLTVSIATVSPVSGLIHLGINIDAEGAPVATAGLGALGIEPEPFAISLLEALRLEVDGVVDALSKVAPAHRGPGS